MYKRSLNSAVWSHSLGNIRMESDGLYPNTSSNHAISLPKWQLGLTILPYLCHKIGQFWAISPICGI